MIFSMNGSKFIANFKELTLWQASRNELPEVAAFVVRENYVHHTGRTMGLDYCRYKGSPYYNEYISVLEEEKKHFEYSISIVVRNQTGTIVGAIRVMKWDEDPNEITLTKLFGADIVSKSNLLANYKHVWHVGRFAVCKDCEEKVNLFRLLMVYAISPIFQYEDGVLLAEIDERLLRVMRLMKIQAEDLTRGVEYLGSVTIPVMITKLGLQDFLLENLSFALNLRISASIESGHGCYRQR